MQLENYFQYNNNLQEHYQFMETLYDQKQYMQYFIFAEIFLKRILITNLIENIESSAIWSDLVQGYRKKIIKKNYLNGTQYDYKTHIKNVENWLRNCNLKKLLIENYQYQIFNLDYQKHDNALNWINCADWEDNKNQSSGSIGDLIYQRNNLMHAWDGIFFDLNYWKFYAVTIKKFITYFVAITKELNLTPLAQTI